ncbi:MAG: M56 family metallopeptidase, partial [Clostridia bacterium]|nr:M56 family metallopeptidase [Clostridia bacterium]
RSAKAADERTQKIFSTICKKYGMKKQPTLLVASGIHSPAAFGIFRRKIVLPDIAFTENGLVGTLAHEVTHCKRGDLYMKLVELIACSLNWFNPLVHIAAFQCEMEMELSCDEKVLSGSSEAARAAYADVMLDIIRRCRRNRGALTTHFNPKKSAVTARFKNILYGSGKRRGRILIGVCLVLCVLAGTFVACQTGDDLPDDHWYAEGYYLKCDNGSDVIVMDADGANPASPCQMTPADDSVSFEGLTDGDRIKIEISMIMTTYPGQTEVYSIEKLSDGERDDIDPVVLDSLRELGWIDDTYTQKELPDYLEIPAITLTQIEALPYSEESAVFTVSPVGGNPTIFFFDDSLTFYFRKYLSTNMDAEYFAGTLTLPDGFTDTKLLHVTCGAGSGEIFVSIEAIYDGSKEYLTYGFFGTDAPAGVNVLDEVQVQRLMEAMEQISTTQITEYKFNIPLGEKLDYIVPAAIYGKSIRMSSRIGMRPTFKRMNTARTAWDTSPSA